MIKILYPEPALILDNENEKYIVISDLHIGFEERFNKQGISIQSSIEKMQEVLVKLIEQEKPNKVIVLGDVKDSVSSMTKSERMQVPKFFREISRLIDIVVVPGNHDGNIRYLLPEKVELADSRGIKINSTALLHGHTNINETFEGINRIIIGHLHPIYNQKDSPLSGYQIWSILKARTDALFGNKKEDLEIITVPSFNKELTASGFSVHRKKNICPIIRKTREDINEAVFLTLDGDIIGDINSLSEII